MITFVSLQSVSFCVCLQTSSEQCKVTMITFVSLQSVSSCVSSDIFRALGPISTRANKASSLGQISNQTEEKVDIELIENKNT